MLAEALEGLNLAPGRRVVDATLGGGGHARAIAGGIAPGGILIGLDQDADAITEAAATLGAATDAGISVLLRQANFESMGAVLTAEGFSAVDGILMDLGVSSHQLDTRGRGFAFRYN